MRGAKSDEQRGVGKKQRDDYLHELALWRDAGPRSQHYRDSIRSDRVSRGHPLRHA